MEFKAEDIEPIIFDKMFLEEQHLKEMDDLNYSLNKMSNDQLIEQYLKFKKRLEIKQEKEINDFYNYIQNHCLHPMLLCTTSNINEDLEYTAKCLVCEKNFKLDYDKMNLFYKNHKILAKQGKDINGNKCYSSPFKTLTYNQIDNLRRCYGQLANIIQKIDDKSIKTPEQILFDFIVKGKKIKQNIRRQISYDVIHDIISMQYNKPWEKNKAKCLIKNK